MSKLAKTICRVVNHPTDSICAALSSRAALLGADSSATVAAVVGD
ncbi:MAG: hypothetical protein ABW205_02770 [Burkholderiales bacterium]